MVIDFRWSRSNGLAWVRLSQKLWLNIESKPTLLTLIPLILTSFEFNQNESAILLLVNLTEFPKALQYNGVKCIIWLSFDYGNWFKHLSLSDTNFIFARLQRCLRLKVSDLFLFWHILIFGNRAARSARRSYTSLFVKIWYTHRWRLLSIKPMHKDFDIFLC